MVDHSLMRGDDFVRCCICGELHGLISGVTPPGLAVDEAGIVWDVCKGECAASAGITEATIASEG